MLVAPGLEGLLKDEVAITVCWAGAIGFARLFLGVHSVVDVLAGWALGIAFALGFHHVLHSGALDALFAAPLFGLLALMGLPRLNHPLFESQQFARCTDDGFFIAIEARDPQFSSEETKTLLEDAGGSNIELVEEPAP